MKLTSKFINEAQYSEIISSINSFSLFHSLEWLSLIKHSMNLKIIFIATLNEKNDIVSVMPLLVKNFFFLKLIGSPLRGTHTQKMGPLVIDDNNSLCIQKDIIYSIEHLINFKFNYFELVFCNNSEENKNFVLSGFNKYKFKTNLIKLIDEDQNWRELHSRARNMIRKAIKNNVKVSIVEISNDWIENFYNLLKNTFLKQGKSVPHSKSFYKNLIFLKKNIVCLEAKKDGQFLSGGIFSLNQKNITFLSGVSSPIGNKLAASSLIQWEIIKYGIENKFFSYDMGGLGVKSIDKFKLSFGGDIVFFEKFIKKDFLYLFCENFLYKIFLKLTFYKHIFLDILNFRFKFKK